jgi:hypothetical protein
VDWKTVAFQTNVEKFMEKKTNIQRIIQNRDALSKGVNLKISDILN